MFLVLKFVGIIKYGLGACAGLVCNVNSAAYMPLPDNTQHSTLATDIHSSGGIRTRNASKRAVANQRIRPRGHWGSAVDLLVMSKL